MGYRPDIDFAPLLERGVMTADELRAVFGREPSSRELKYARIQFRAKHPDKAALVRSERAGGGRLYLMAPGSSSTFRAARITGAVKTVGTEVELHSRVPVAELTETERRQHRVTSDAAVQAMIALNPLRKALPGHNER